MRHAPLELRQRDLDTEIATSRERAAALQAELTGGA